MKPKTSEHLSNITNSNLLENNDGLVFILLKLIKIVKRKQLKSNLWQYKEHSSIFNQNRIKFQTTITSVFKGNSVNIKENGNKNDHNITENINPDNKHNTNKNSNNSEFFNKYEQINCNIYLNTNNNNNLEINNKRKNTSDENNINKIRKFSLIKKNFKETNYNNISRRSISRDNADNKSSSYYKKIDFKSKNINNCRDSFTVTDAKNSKFSYFDDSKSYINNDSKNLIRKTISSTKIYNQGKNISNTNNHKANDNLNNSLCNNNLNYNYNNNNCYNYINKVNSKSGPFINNNKNNSNNNYKNYNTDNTPANLKQTQEISTITRPFSNLSPVFNSTSPTKSLLNRKSLTSENFFLKNPRIIKSPVIPELRNSSTLKDSLADLGPYIKTKLASPPAGLRKCKLGSVLDVKSPKGTESLRTFYLKYKKESQNFEEIYFNKYLKTETKREKDLAFFDKKYNFKTLFKVRKNYDYFLENKIRFDQDLTKSKSNNISNSAIKNSNNFFSFKSINSNGICDNNNYTMNNNNNSSSKIDLRKYKEMIKNSKNTSKLTDKKRLDLLYKYDDFFKMRLENIKAKRKVDNLYDYQKEIVKYFLIKLFVFLNFYHN